MKRLKIFSVMITMIFTVGGCNEWDDHNKAVDAALTTDLLKTIQSNPELSTFASYLASTGLDETLTLSKKFTVWAPDNAALQDLDNSIKNDANQLKQFISNHISYQEYFTSSPTIRIKMLSGKYLTWSGSSLEDAAAKSSNQLARNGVLHIVNKKVIPKPNIWETLMGAAVQTEHYSYLESLNYIQFVDSLAVQIGIDQATGKPVYQEGTGLVERNKFLDEILNVKKEEGLYTFFLLTDEAFQNELQKLKPFFKTSTLDEDSTKAFASWYLSRDLVFDGMYSIDELPETFTSNFGAEVPVDKNAIVETWYTSNGIVYLMNKVDFQLESKFLPIIIEGEKPASFSRTDKALNIHYRYRDWASEKFDLRIRDHSVALFNVRYAVPDVPSTTYRVYLRAVNDFIGNTFQQRLMIGSPVANTFPYVIIGIENYDEILLGEYVVDKYGGLNLYLVSANSTNNTLNPLVLDYIKLVPVF